MVNLCLTCLFPGHCTLFHASKLVVQIVYTKTHFLTIFILKKNFEPKMGEISEYVENIPLAEILLRPFFLRVGGT